MNKMGNHGRRMAAKQAESEQRQRRAKLIVRWVIAVVIVVAAIAVLADAKVGQSEPVAPVTVATKPADMFAGLTALPDVDEQAGWVVSAPSSPGMTRWLGISNTELMVTFERCLTPDERQAMNAQPQLRSVDWVSRMQIPAPVNKMIGDRRAVIVGQVHAIEGPKPGTVDLRPDVVDCQREIYRFLLHEQQEQDDLTILHEGVPTSRPITVDNGQAGLAPFIAGVQFALRNPGIEHLPAEDELVMDLGDALGCYSDPDAVLDEWSDGQQIAVVEMRSRAMARVMAETLNRGRTPVLIVGDAHEAGAAIALNNAGYKVAIWQPTVLRLERGQ